MAAPEERKHLDRAVGALRRIVFGERQSIRTPQKPTPQADQPKPKP